MQKRIKLLYLLLIKPKLIWAVLTLIIVTERDEMICSVHQNYLVGSLSVSIDKLVLWFLPNTIFIFLKYVLIISWTTYCHFFNLLTQ